MITIRNIKIYFWIVPFLVFGFGYFLAHTFLKQSTVQMPALVGLPVYKAVGLLTEADLNLRIMLYKEDPDLEEGMIISQSPFAGQQVQQGQIARVVVTKKPQPLRAPSLVGLQSESIKTIAQEKGLLIKTYPIHAPYSCGMCIAQIPEAGLPLTRKSVALYESASQELPYIVPHLHDKTVAEITELCAPHGIKVVVKNEHKKSADTSIIIDQRPLAGSCVLLSELSVIEVQIR